MQPERENPTRFDTFLWIHKVNQDNASNQVKIVTIQIFKARVSHNSVSKFPGAKVGVTEAKIA